MFGLLIKDLQLTILIKYLKIQDACLIRPSNKLILLDINEIFEETIKNKREKERSLKISNIFKNSYYMNSTEINIIWEVPLESIRICKKNGKELILKKNDIISLLNRELGVKITNFTGNADQPGPIGLEYLPWRGTRYATPQMTLRGNPRHIITYPWGIKKYGEHINWYFVRLMNLT